MLENFDQKQDQINLQLVPDLGITYHELIDQVCTKSFIGQQYAANPPRWNNLAAKHGTELFFVNEEMYFDPRVKKQITAYLINDADPVGHLRHTFIVTQSMLADALRNGDYYTQREIQKLLVAAALHDIQEGLTGDKVSGTKDTNDRLIEMQAFKNQLIATYPDPEVRKVLNEAFEVLLADEKLQPNEIDDKQILGLPQQVIQGRKTKRNRELHRIYSDSHLLTFYSAVFGMDIDNEDTRELKNEVNVKKWRQFKLAALRNPYVRRYYEHNKERILNY